MAFGKLVEILSKFEEVCLVFDQFNEVFHAVICFFAEDEESDAVVGFDVIEVVDVGSDELEDKHDVVPSVQVIFLVSFNGL